MFFFSFPLYTPLPTPFVHPTQIHFVHNFHTFPHSILSSTLHNNLRLFVVNGYPVSPLSSPPSPLVDASCGPFSPLCVWAQVSVQMIKHKKQNCAQHMNKQKTEKNYYKIQTMLRAHVDTNTHTRRHIHRERLALALKVSQRHLQSSSNSQAEAATVAEAATAWIRLNMRGPFVCCVCVCVCVCVFWSFPLLRRRLSVNAKCCLVQRCFCRSRCLWYEFVLERG